MPTLFINGKFCAQHTAGVQRFATELLRAADRVRMDRPAAPRWVLLHPPGAEPPALSTVDCRALGPRGLPLHLWEQLLLPVAAASGLLLDLAGSAPLWSRRQVCTFHDAAVFDWPQAYTRSFTCWYRMLFRVQARRACSLITVSNFARARLAYHLQIEPGRIAVVPGGAEHLATLERDDRVLDRLGLRGRRFVLAVASENPSKNLARLVQAAESLPPQTEGLLVTVGRAFPGVFAPSAARAGRRVLSAGPVEDVELAALLRHARGLVCPSLYEGFGLPPLEAMSLDCPVAVSRAASLPEVCGDAARYFDPESVAEIAAALQDLFLDDRLCAELAERGRERIRRFSWRASAQALLAHLLSLGVGAQ